MFSLKRSELCLERRLLSSKLQFNLSRLWGLKLVKLCSYISASGTWNWKLQMNAELTERKQTNLEVVIVGRGIWIGLLQHWRDVTGIATWRSRHSNWKTNVFIVRRRRNTNREKENCSDPVDCRCRELHLHHAHSTVWRRSCDRCEARTHSLWFRKAAAQACGRSEFGSLIPLLNFRNVYFAEREIAFCTRIVVAEIVPH